MQENVGTDFNSEIDLRRYEALLQMADLMVHHRSLGELFHELARRLQSVADFEFVAFVLHDAMRDVMRLSLWEGAERPLVPAEMPPEECAAGWVWQNQVPLVLDDLNKEDRCPGVFDVVRERGVRSYCMLPLSTMQRRLGALGFGSRQVSAYSKDSLRFLERVAELVALALENALNREALAEEQQRLQAVLEVHRLLVSNRDPQQVFSAISESLRRVIPLNYASVSLHDRENDCMRVLVRDVPPPGVEPGTAIPSSDSVAALAITSGETQFFSRSDPIPTQSPAVRRLFEQGVQSGCCIPLITPNGALGTLNLASTSENAFRQENMDLLRQVAGQLAVALEDAFAYQEIERLKNKLEEEKLYLQDEIRTAFNFEEIIGESPALKRVLAQAETVAASDATVLLLGETGTGKELVARAIHRMSRRKENNFIKLNCSAIPTGLLESELFGHEKGAFTGAISQKIGRLELADKGTLFLDEVGDIALELQPKLLRVLQDQEFERLGSTRTIRVDVRLIAATNRDLARSMAEGEFRSDLYYRLHVFPIRMPPLRERRKDIPLLVRYFVQKFARRMDRQIETIPSETMSAFLNWDWPGNVRELENFIERSVILTEGKVLRTPLAELQPLYESRFVADSNLQTVEREHILRMLRETGGLISGPHGAAERLGLKRTTLQSMIQRFGISRTEYAANNTGSQRAKSQRNSS